MNDKGLAKQRKQESVIEKMKIMNDMIYQKEQYKDQTQKTDEYAYEENNG